MSAQRINEFKVDQMYSSDEIQQSLGVGNAGGVRAVIGNDDDVRRIVIMTSVPTARQARENPYHDRLEGDILVYTGAGREGEQSLAGVNKRLPQQLRNGFPMYCFLIVGSRRDPTIGPRRWQFLGLLEFLRHYPDTHKSTRAARSEKSGYLNFGSTRNRKRSLWIMILRTLRRYCLHPARKIAQLTTRRQLPCRRW